MAALRMKRIGRSFYIFFIICMIVLFSFFFLSKNLKKSDNISLFDKEDNIRNKVFDLQKSYQTNLEINEKNIESTNLNKEVDRWFGLVGDLIGLGGSAMRAAALSPGLFV